MLFQSSFLPDNLWFFLVEIEEVGCEIFEVVNFRAGHDLYIKEK